MRGASVCSAPAGKLATFAHLPRPWEEVMGPTASLLAIHGCCCCSADLLCGGSSLYWLAWVELLDVACSAGVAGLALLFPYFSQPTDCPAVRAADSQ